MTASYIHFALLTPPLLFNPLSLFCLFTSLFPSLSPGLSQASPWKQFDVGVVNIEAPFQRKS